jgi:hypothetical protein
MSKFGLHEHIVETNRIILVAPEFDFDSFPDVGEQLLTLLSATVIEKQVDADLHSWIIDFEGCQLIVKAEHYSGTVWIESLGKNESREEMEFIARLLKNQS